VTEFEQALDRITRLTSIHRSERRDQVHLRRVGAKPNRQRGQSVAADLLHRLADKLEQSR